MSHILWKHYLEDNVEKFEAFLATGHNAPHTQKGHAGGQVHVGSMGAFIGSPGNSSSPRATMKSRKTSGHLGVGKAQSTTLSRAEVNARDQMGLTVLHRAVSSSAASALQFATALIEHPSIDIYAQDLENGWTALHRALYFGNVGIARMLLAKDQKTSSGQGLIKIKDHEGNSAFDVFNATIARRTLDHRGRVDDTIEEDEEDGNESVTEEEVSGRDSLSTSVDGDEVFAFGSNKNLNLGFGDEDDRQHPERIVLKRPDHLLRRFYTEHVESTDEDREPRFSDIGAITSSTPISELPALIKNRPIVIQDVKLSKLHSAILTTDPESNLHICGFGPGGRLGTGDETTRFNYVCIEGGALAGKKIVAVALGQNHTLAVSKEGEIFTWGTNSHGQLGYSLPRPIVQDEEPVNSTPRQIFGPLKREVIIGVAASSIHSVAHTSTSIFTWGRNNGQLGLMDSDSRSLDIQTTPRKVAASLFSSPIQMVSAIDRATICLLANHSVCVFTNYGYNYVKFPLYEGFSNHYLNALSTRYEAESYISQITSGGDTIAAVSSRGDLFTVIVNQNPGPTAASTTNPAKIKNALSQPQRVWSLRKGHWDGIKSVGVSENGSVIICTQAGAVYLRVKRAKIKFATELSDSKKKDFKFQRVSGLTNVVAVRSSIYGTYAAIRKDCDVTRSQVLVEDQRLWRDVAPLLSLKGFVPSEPPIDEGVVNKNRFWSPAISKEHFHPFKRAVLISPDLEKDIANHVVKFSTDDYDVEVLSTISDTRIPAHGFMLGARSSIIREALAEFNDLGVYELPDILTVSSDGNRKQIQFHGLDFITILNLVLYVYEDSVVDVWHFTRAAPNSAFRFRQVRTELMKVASKLNMSKLEIAVRLMVEPEPRLNVDLAMAIQDTSYFDDGDTIIELDGEEIRVHSALMRQRCPFFEGIFGGRAGGQWLASRREADTDVVRIDMKHIDPSAFELVLRYIYADVGTELFDNIVATDLDELCEIIMDVLAAANELMLDRLSQICQKVLARFVNTRNICTLINVVAPCAVTEFKDAGLEYLCLQLECMLENHLLDDLDEDLLAELDEVVRDNQLACLPFAKSGRAELVLHEKYPGLAGEVDEERQRKIRDLAFRAQNRDEDARLSSSFKHRVGSLDDILASSPQDKGRRKSRGPRNAPFSPVMLPKDSTTADLMFDMDDEDSNILDAASPKQASSPWVSAPTTAPASGTATPLTIRGSQHEGPGTAETVQSTQSPTLSPSTPTQIPSMSKELLLDNTSSPISTPWSARGLPSTKLGMKEIMAQASTSRTSSLSMSLSAQKATDDTNNKSSASRISQKERKKQQQQALQQAIAQPRSSLGDASPISPWQVASPGTKISMKDVLGDAPKNSPLALPQTSSSPIAPLSLSKRRTASPDTRFSGQRRSNSTTPVSQTPKSISSPSGSSRPQLPPPTSKSTPLIPHTKSYTSPAAKAEPSLQLSMADIIGQQRREQDLIKEAVAKRSLQEIQEEQAFQEWWDQESKRAQEEEAARLKGAERASSSTNRGKSSKRGRGGNRGARGGNENAGRGRGKGKSQGSTSDHAKSQTS